MVDKAAGTEAQTTKLQEACDLLRQLFLALNPPIRESELIADGSGQVINSSFPIKSLYCENTDTVSNMSIYEGGDSSRPPILVIPPAPSAGLVSVKTVKFVQGKNILFVKGKGIVKFSNRDYDISGDSQNVLAQLTGSIVTGPLGELLLDANTGNNTLAKAGSVGDGAANQIAGVGIFGASGTQPGYWFPIRVSNGISHSLPSTALAAGATATVWTPAAGKRFRLLFALVSASAATEIRLYDGSTAGANLADVLIAANTPIAIPLPPNGALSASVGNALLVYSSAAANVAVTAYGTEE